MKQPKKTIAKWISELPEPTRIKAERYLKSDANKRFPDDGNTMQDALLCAFQWSETKEGFNFWKAIHNTYEQEN